MAAGCRGCCYCWLTLLLLLLLLLAAGCWLLATCYMAEHIELVSTTQTARAKHVAELYDNLWRQVADSKINYHVGK